MEKYINQKYHDIFLKPGSLTEEYLNAEPFASAVFKEFFNPEILDEILSEFPDLSKEKSIKFDDPIQRKLAGRGEKSFGSTTRDFMHFLNSEPFLNFLQELTSIEERLIPDPYFFGGGLHEIKRDGVLKLHADYKRHEHLGLDRRLNTLIYLNKDWSEDYGGHFEMWDTKLENCVKKVLPEFNTLAIFSTTDYTFHGHPNPLNCPEDRSRKSLALYFFSNGRPESEINPEKGEFDTLFVPRKGHQKDEQDFKETVAAVKKSNLVREFIPPIILKGLKKLKNR